MKKIKMITLLMLSLVLITIVGCGKTGSGEQSTEEPNKEQVKEDKLVLTMATSGDYYPYEFYDTSSGNGEIQGFDIDIANYIAEELGFELKIMDIDFNGLIAALQVGKADFVLAGMTPTPERLENADFSEIYFEAQNTIIAKKDSNYKTAEDLIGKTVGVQLGSIQEEEAKGIEGVEVKLLNRIPEIIQEVKSGRIDAAIVEDTVAKGYIESYPDLEFHTIPNKESAGSAIAFPKGSKYVEDFNKVLQHMKENGELEKLILKWFEE